MLIAHCVRIYLYFDLRFRQWSCNLKMCWLKTTIMMLILKIMITHFISPWVNSVLFQNCINYLLSLHIRPLVEIYANNMVIYYGSLRYLVVVYALISSMNVVNDLLELKNLSIETKRLTNRVLYSVQIGLVIVEQKECLLKILSVIR